jgi:hypothetical protein
MKRKGAAKQEGKEESMFHTEFVLRSRFSGFVFGCLGVKNL